MFPHYNFLRKAPADFGWDWGLALAPAGIYGGVLLVAYNTVYITGDFALNAIEPLTFHDLPCMQQVAGLL